MIRKGSLAVVGTGIRYADHLTAEADCFIREADKVLYVIPGPWADEWMLSLNKTAESLVPLYSQHKTRLETYGAMVSHIISYLERGLDVCAVFYGHPGVFVLPSHEVVKQARAAGYSAWMCPGVSAEDCLFAEVGFDPAAAGCQSFEATDFLLRHRRFDPHSNLVIWQVGVVGNVSDKLSKDTTGLEMLVEELEPHYGGDHEVTIFESAPHPDYRSRIETFPLRKLPEIRMMTISTLYIPPKPNAAVDPERLARLGMSMNDITKHW